MKSSAPMRRSLIQNETNYFFQESTRTAPIKLSTWHVSSNVMAAPTSPSITDVMPQVGVACSSRIRQWRATFFPSPEESVLIPLNWQAEAGLHLIYFLSLHQTSYPQHGVGAGDGMNQIFNLFFHSVVYFGSSFIHSFVRSLVSWFIDWFIQSFLRFEPRTRPHKRFAEHCLQDDLDELTNSSTCLLFCFSLLMHGNLRFGQQHKRKHCKFCGSILWIHTFWHSKRHYRSIKTR